MSDELSFSGVDTIPVLAQAKAAYQQYWGDEHGARETKQNFWTFSLGASQVASLLDLFYGNVEPAQHRQRRFMAGSVRVAKAIPDGIPVIGHLVGGARFCAGDREGGKRAGKRASRSCCVFSAGLLVGGAGVLVSGFDVHGAKHVAQAAVAAVAGVAAGIKADALWFPHSIPPVIEMTPGQRFDLMVLRALDGLRAVVGMDLVPILWPEYVTQASVWVEPLTLSDAAHLLTGQASPTLEQLNSGMLHSFVLLKTTKGRVLLTERLHNDHIVVVDVSRPELVEHFSHGQLLPSQGIEALERSQDGATMFAVKQLIAGGPSAASFEHFAAAQSNIGYDLIQSNCQHYADSVLEFVSGKGLTYLPNGNMLSISSMLLPPMPPMPYVPAGVFGSTFYEACLAPGRAAADLAIAAWPRLPQADGSSDDARGPVPVQTPATQRRPQPQAMPVEQMRERSSAEGQVHYYPQQPEISGGSNVERLIE